MAAVATRGAISAYLTRTDLTPAQVRRGLRRIRGRALREAIQGVALPRSFNLPGQRTVTVERIDLLPNDDAVQLWVSWTRQGKTMPFSNPWVIVNPPLLVPDPAGEVARHDGSRWREDATAVFLELCDRTFR